ncbi:6112_t:CDS:10 [Entrophospora sp. SA101]|nr:6112_t:CDS:10 [Entrophospora sp. SA101]
MIQYFGPGNLSITNIIVPTSLLVVIDGGIRNGNNISLESIPALLVVSSSVGISSGFDLVLEIFVAEFQGRCKVAIIISSTKQVVDFLIKTFNFKEAATISITTVTTAASTELSNNMVIETPQIPKEKLIHQKILKDLEFVTERNPLVPDEWAPLKFNNPDNHKFQPGGSYWTVVNDKKRKRSFTYTPDYKPQHLQAKKPRLEKEIANDNLASSDESSSGDYDSDDYSTDSSIDFNDRAETNLQDCDRSSRNLGFVNSARFMSVIATLSLFALALDSLRDQVALGSYPFGVGLKGEGESISELVDSKQRLMQALKGELPVASALPCEIDDVTNSFKEVVNDVCKKLPKSETLKEITVKGPLTLNAYCDLIAHELSHRGCRCVRASLKSFSVLNGNEENGINGAAEVMKRNHIDHNGQSPSGVETSMTPNTPGLANNATSNVNSPGHNNLSSPSSSRTKKRSSGETKASYPSPPDLQASSSSSNDLLPLNDEYGMMDEVFGYDVDIIEQEITEDDFEMFDTMNEPKKITTQPVNTTHNLTATISITTVTTAASTELSNNMVIETPQIPKEKLIHQKILKDLEFVTERNPLVPDEWAPLKFNNPDNHKFQPGGSYWTVVNDKKRKRSFTYTPDYKPQHLQAKKPRLEKEIANDNLASSDESSSGDYDSDDYSTDSSIDFNDRAETNLQDCDRSSRNLGFVNSARFMSVIATLSLFALALDSLRDQVALGSYPFGVGLKGEGESISELVDSKQRLMQALKGELPVASALPCEIDDVTNSFKEVVNDVCKKLPKSETLKEITVKGPLTLNAYCDLIGTEYLNKGEGEVPLSFLEELPTPDITVAATEGSNEYLIDCSPEIIQYWDKHNIIPYDGKKNIRYYVLYPDNEHLRDYVKSFFDRLSIHYEMCSLGSHKSAEMNGTFHGLIPIFLNQPVLGESELNRRIKSYEDRFSIFGKKYLTKMIDPYQNEHIVIYIVNPFNHSSANYDVMYSFVRLIMEFKKELGSRLNQKIIDKIIPQIVPAEHIITYGETIFNTAHDKQLLQQLAFKL